MFTKSDVLVMVQVAEMHYVYDMEQDEIAEKMKIPSELISKILDEACKLGIVEVKIRSIA